MITIIKRLYQESEQGKNIKLLGLLYIVLALFNFAASFYLGKITQSTVSSAFSTLVLDLILLTIFSIIYEGLNLYIKNQMTKIRNKTNAKFKTKSAKALLKGDYNESHQYEQGDLIGRISNDTMSLAIATENSLIMTRSVVLLSMIAIGTLFLDYRLGLAFILTLPLIFIVQYINASQSLKYVIPWKISSSNVDNTTQDILNNRSTIKSFNLYQKASEWMNDVLNDYASKGIKGVSVLYSFGIITIIVNFIPIFTIGIVGLNLLQDNLISLSSLITAITLCSFSQSATNDFQNAIQNLTHQIASAERIFPLWDLDVEDSGSEEGKNSDLIIDVKNLYFKYPESDQYVLKDISFSLSKGERLAIVGTSGSGKSTIIKLLSKFYHPSEGSIDILSLPLSEWDTKMLRDKLGLISQNNYLFDKSIRDNLLLAKEDASDAKLLDVLKKAKLDDFVLEHGLDYVIGEKGSKLSGGQRQRLSIARVLLKESDLWLFDEATSALDSKTEKEIQVLLERFQDQSQIIIAHRLSTIVNADTILVMDQGEIIERGNHESLLELDGVYAKLFRKEKFEND